MSGKHAELDSLLSAKRQAVQDSMLKKFAKVSGTSRRMLRTLGDKKEKLAAVSAKSVSGAPISGSKHADLKEAVAGMLAGKRALLTLGDKKEKLAAISGSKPVSGAPISAASKHAEIKAAVDEMLLGKRSLLTLNKEEKLAAAVSAKTISGAPVSGKRSDLKAAVEEMLGGHRALRTIGDKAAALQAKVSAAAKISGAPISGHKHAEKLAKLGA